MRTTIALLLCFVAGTMAFAPTPGGMMSRRSNLALRMSTTDAPKFNYMIELDSPKVATMEKIKAGEKKVYCRCWQSGTWPLCNGAHVKHNEKTVSCLASTRLLGKTNSFCFKPRVIAAYPRAEGLRHAQSAYSVGELRCERDQCRISI